MLDKAPIPHYRPPRNYGLLAVTSHDDGSILSESGLFFRDYVLLMKLGVATMIKRESVCLDADSRTRDSGAQYDRVKAIIAIAKKNGWDIEELELIPKDLPNEPLTLTKRQIQQRNKLVKAILEKFSRALTPPVPPDLETYIRGKMDRDRLPWEQEALEKVEDWRKKVAEIRPQILGELRRAFATR